MRTPKPLTDADRARYEWQMWVPGFGEEGQRKLKGASVLISRVGGLGGVVAYQLAAAGVGKLVLAMGGKVKPSDLNRHLQQSHARIGEARLPAVVRRLQELNPRLEIVEPGQCAHEHKQGDERRHNRQRSDVVPPLGVRVGLDQCDRAHEHHQIRKHREPEVDLRAVRDP